MKTAMTIEYEGGAYYGFQRQTAGPTVQGELERVLTTVLRQPITVRCAGRTDTGVSALGQVVHFVSDVAPELDKLIYAVNSLLPFEIAVRHAAAVPDNFHARFSCLAREYVYMIYNAPFRSATVGYKALWVRDALDWQPVKAAIPDLLGEKNFAAFTRMAVVKRGDKTHRRIESIRIIEEGKRIYVHIRGSGFLHNMIRIIIGTLLDVARGVTRPDQVAQILASGDRLTAGVTVKPHGLYFLHAEYADYDQTAAQHDLRRVLLSKDA